MAARKGKGFTHESAAAQSIEWYTPRWVFDAIGERFDLDVCAPEGGVPWVPADRSYSVADDGLAQPWSGFVWCNPPYGQATPVWLQKMHAHHNGLAIVFARTDCGWFHDYCANADCIMFLRGRIKFVNGEGLPGKTGPGNGSMLVGWGPRAYKALAAMELLGYGKFVDLTK